MAKQNFIKKNITAIKSLLKNIKKSLSIRYFDKNLTAIIKEEKEWKKKTLPKDLKDFFKKVINSEIDNEDIYNNIKLKKLELWYPILLIFNDKNEPYDEIIKDTINKINKEITKPNLKNENEIDINIFFMLIPVKSSDEIKREVIKWITENKQLER